MCDTVCVCYVLYIYPVFRSIRPTFASPPRKSQASGSMLRPQETPAEAEAPAEPASESTGFSGSMGSIGSIGSTGPQPWRKTWEWATFMGGTRTRKWEVLQQ